MIALFALASVAVVNPVDLDVRRGEAVLADFAKCSVKFEHDLAKQLVLGRAVDSMSDDELRRVLDPRCLGLWGVDLHANGVAIRGALAEALVHHDLGHWPELDPTSHGPLDWSVPPTLRAGPTIRRISPAVLHKFHEIDVRDARLGHIGECVVRASPSGSAAVLNAKLNSTAEAAALEALKPDVTACITAGEFSHFARDGLRYALALSYYDLANGPPVSAALRTPEIASMYAFKSVGASVYTNTPEELALQALHNFGACVVSRTPDGARQLLSLDFSSSDYEKSMQRYIRGHDYCIPVNSRMSSSGLLFAGAVAEASLKFGSKSADLPRRMGFDAEREVIAARGPSEEMALCTVLNAPEETARIFATEPATAEETAALKPLGGVLTQCLKKGAQLTINKPALRALLALAAWRIVNTPRKPVS
jgi:hypothetical protein